MKSILRDAYYLAKPHLPREFRMQLRRLYSRRIREKHADHWPIDQSAGQRPRDWAGWPKGAEFAVVVTHDVEGSLGYENVRQLAEYELQRGIKASYNFVPEGEYEVSDELVHWLKQEGFEVGVHDLHHDGFLYSSREAFAEKAVKINRYVKKWGATGFRSAFMLRQLTWLHDLDVLYDSSTFDRDPFEPQPEGAGTIFPFMVNGEENQEYVELPYTLPQDSTLFLLLEEEGPEIWMKKLDWIREHGGMALVNIHPDYIDMNSTGTKAHTYALSHYGKFLDHLESKHSGRYWNPLPGELALWYKNQKGL